MSEKKEIKEENVLHPRDVSKCIFKEEIKKKADIGGRMRAQSGGQGSKRKAKNSINSIEPK